MGDIFRPEFLRAGLTMDGPEADSLSVQDKLIIQLSFNLGWMSALVGLEQAVTKGAFWWLLPTGVFLMVLSVVWPHLGTKVREWLATVLYPLAKHWRTVLLVLAVLAWMVLAYEVSSVRNDLDTYVAPRALTSGQAERFTDFLRQSSKHLTVEVVANRDDREALAYSGQFLDPINNAGWKAVWNLWPGPSSPPPDGPPAPRQPVNDGLFVGTTGANDDGDGRKTLVNALRRAGIDVNGCEFGTGSHLWLLIGRRPIALGDQRPLKQRVIDWFEGGAKPCG